MSLDIISPKSSFLELMSVSKATSSKITFFLYRLHPCWLILNKYVYPSTFTTVLGILCNSIKNPHKFSLIFEWKGWVDDQAVSNQVKSYIFFNSGLLNQTFSVKSQVVNDLILL